MKQFLLTFFAVFACFLQTNFAQIPTNKLVQIVRTEDERRWDSVLESFLKDADAKVRVRAALAAGRIGDERAIPALADLLTDSSTEVQTIAMFALGETESAKASDAVSEVLKSKNIADSLRGRALEAAGKIVAANPKDAKTSELGKLIVSSLNNELGKSSAPNAEVVLLGETAILRARPEGAERLLLILLNEPNARIRADALNTLVRLRSKNAGDEALNLLQKDSDPIVRANAARLLALSDKDFPSEYLLEPAMFDKDARVRVSAIRALAAKGDPLAASKLLVRTQTLMAAYRNSQKRLANPAEKNELLEIASALGKLIPNTKNQEAIDFLVKFNEADKYQSPEIEIALAQLAPAKFSERQRNKKDVLKADWKAFNSMMQGIGELAKVRDTDEIKPNKDFAKAMTVAYIGSQLLANLREDKTLSDALTAYAAFKPDDLAEVLRDALPHRDAVVRATVAGLLAQQTSSKENVEALKTAFAKSLLADKSENDAQLAILDALYKLDKKASVGTFLIALNAPDYLVRKKAFEILKDEDLQKDFPGIQSNLANFTAKKQNQVLPYAASTGTKLGQILNANADYMRALSRKNGTVKAVLTTTKGTFTIDFFTEDAPLTVDNFIKLARSNYFNGLEVHRVVPNFVMQDGDPRGDGSGGPGWQIRCEINTLPYERGTVGMALSGKDTGGSQWFITHSSQPHLDGGYTVFGKVNENDMKIVDSIVRGDKILSVRIIEGRLPARNRQRR